MKAIRYSTLCLGVLLLSAALLPGEDLSKYRGFALGTSMANVLKLSNETLPDVKTICSRPMLIQELIWWPPSTSGIFSRPEAVQQITFSFSNGLLYKIFVTYEHSSTEGLTAADMVKSISAKYGPVTSVESEIDPAMASLYNLRPAPLASWRDSQYSFDLVRTSSSTGRFGLVIYSQQVNADAELAKVESAQLDEQQRPEKEASEKKKEADDLQAAREKNQKSFRP
jgi:hypothetical protein